MKFAEPLGFSLLVSLVSGVYPARRAARVDPVVALRHDYFGLGDCLGSPR